MKAATFALIAGIVYLAIGILGLVPAMLVPPPIDAPTTSFALLYGYLFGVFPVNVLHSAVHIATGFWGLCAWRRRCSAVAYAREVAMSKHSAKVDAQTCRARESLRAQP